ncbi:60S ribosomal protein L7 [Apophysomyces sp. BC1034]|nr:60S ribosomal protein L7 [Apophysomyces sp. BC1015]KAG0177393.1 60S ribosomal protein L7 [Apophysomyces sp. BC1021]KAG0185739.1 60S ribosomal protein L7 [Apophysomyces sp. BC1034]
MGTSVPTAEQICVPETLLKKRKADEKAAAEASQKKAQKQLDQKELRRTIFKRAEEYVHEYTQREKEENRLRRQAKHQGNFFVPPQSRLLFVVRIKGINDMHPKVSKVLTLFRLLQINNGVFLRLNKATAQMLQIIEPFVTYGPPNFKTVRELLYKRGFGKINKQRIPLHDNAIIKESLGKYGIICMEDVIHEIFTVGPHFKEVNHFLWPFKLSNPSGKGMWRPNKFRHFVEGGDAGDRESYINKLVQAMI